MNVGFQWHVCEVRFEDCFHHAEVLQVSQTAAGGGHAGELVELDVL